MISDHLTRLSYFFPWSLVVALILAIIFAILGIIIFRRALRKQQEPEVEKASPFIERCKQFFARFGYFPTDPLSQSFTYALKLMHEFIGGEQFRYQMPWIVMVGTSNAGKSSMLQSLELDRPIGRPHFDFKGGDKPLCDWGFFNHGIALDLDGKIVLDPVHAISDEANWKLFLNLLTHHRPKRPLDGVVLTIPASEFVGQTALSHDDIMIRAEYLYGKLWKMQHITGMRVPIYVVVTKCDLVPGFDSFCQSIPTHNRRDIFGWSNDHAVDSIYAPEWIDEAFSSINESLYRAQEEIYADGKTTDNRDGVFLFPIALNQVKGGIETYANHLFKPSSYHESFFLRGIYFIGDSHLDKPSSESTSASEVSSPFQNRDDEKKRNLYFVDNLFENKIFREIGLARPLSRTLLGNTTAMKYAKVITALLAVGGTIALLRANDTLQKAKMNLVPALSQVQVTLEKIHGQNVGTEVGRVFFDDQAQVLLNTMTQISVNHLTSPFIPPSWFDNLDAKIKYIMGLAYDHVILRSMANELIYKAQQLFSLDTIIPVTEPVGNGINPLQTNEFYRLKNYIVAVRTLELEANKFNELGMTSSLRDVADIIKYLFNYEMPAAFYENDEYYLAALKRTNLKLFDFDGYRDNASIKLRKLFDEFQISTFDANQMIPGLTNLINGLDEFSGARNYTAYDADLLRNILNSLQETVDSISNPGLQWIDADHFNPGPQYEYVIGLIIGSNFFSTTLASDLIREIDQNFTNFKKRLGSLTSPLIKGGNLFNVENGMAVARPSQGALELLEDLKAFFNEPFMAEAVSKAILTTIPTGSILLWDTLRLQEGVNLVDVYNNFMNSRLLQMPKVLQPILQKVARESLTKNLISHIANAEIFSSQTITGGNISPEDSLLSQVQNYRAAAPYLEQLLFDLKANNANNAFSILKNLLISQAYSPIEKLDEILTEESPYAIKMNSFDWWDGNCMLGLEAFGVSNLTELKNYLNLQRDRINYLAREFAEPLVSFLEQINKEGMPGNLPLVTKWVGIINELNGYARKAPGNGLVELEDFILNTLNEVTLGTCKKYLSAINKFPLSQDFFVSILLNLEEKLLNRCTNLSGCVSADSYSQLAQFFNVNLAGKFPFVKTVEDSVSDADPEDIRTFFEMMDSQGSNVKATLKEATNLGQSGKDALAFIEQMEKVRSFFGGYLAPNSTLPYPAFGLNITFRVNREREVYANEVLDWKFTAGDTTITMRSPSHKCYWMFGNPVKVTFRWALNSPLQPEMVEGIPNLDVQGENASFIYSGPWALLRLLRQHQADPCNFDSLKDETPITLRFDIPLIGDHTSKLGNGTEDIEKASVFVRFETSPVAMQPVKKEQTSMGPPPKPNDQNQIRLGKPVALPYFPYNAPRLETPRS